MDRRVLETKQNLTLWVLTTRPWCRCHPMYGLWSALSPIDRLPLDELLSWPPSKELQVRRSARSYLVQAAKQRLPS